MSTTMTTNFLEQVQLIDDTDVAVDSKTYAVQSNPAPPAPGVYAVRIKGFDFARTKAGELISDVRKIDGREKVFPRTVLEHVEIMEPVESRRHVMLYQQIFSTPQERTPGRFGSQLGDLVRAFDATANFKGNAVFERIGEGVERGQLIYVRIDWTATDFDWVNQQIEEQGLVKGTNKTEINALYGKGQIKGYKKFPQTPNGNYSHIWEGPSGNLVEAKPYVSRFFASNEKLPNLGVDKQFAPF